MFQIVYVSSAVTEFTKTQLRALLERSREKNLRLGITGLLLYRGGNFMQVLEGPEPAVRELFQRISQDPRQKDIVILIQMAVPDREFPNWSMAFHDLDIEDASALPGYSDFLRHSWTRLEGSADGSIARKLLASFKERLR